ncbi:MAG: hypothetical protein PHO26_02920 [Dehalococcoidia bacterium]|nr:hypothetical protein [Dehalococcoidia bacterium]MDD5493992.1 hypothetical protein [Dehalococcoidia bacterium]
MQQRFRRGVIAVDRINCDGCEIFIQPGQMYLSIDEKPSDRIKEEAVFADNVNCDECGKPLEDGDRFLFILDSDAEKCYCSSCLKKKGGEAYARKNLGKTLIYEKTGERSQTLRFCQECCEKRKAGMVKKEKGDKIFTLFTTKVAR